MGFSGLANTQYELLYRVIVLTTTSTRAAIRQLLSPL